MSVAVEPASFRDPSGYVFEYEGALYRAVHNSYAEHYDGLMGSGLYEALTDAGLLVRHSEVVAPAGDLPGAEDFRFIRPDRVPFISYPYEWSFSQLQDAALATLRIQNEALKFDMWLKDASAYNIQFRGGKPVLIDTLSFEKYEEGRPWPAYRQFCQHFLAPLALMSRTDIRLGSLLRTNIDGVPLDLAGKLLPGKTKFDGGLLTHIHLHGAAQKKYEGSEVSAQKAGKVSKTGILGIVDSLLGTVKKLSWSPSGTTWSEYYSETNYTDAAMAAKRGIVREMLLGIEPKPASVWDLGANTGEFSKVAAELGCSVIAWDVDPGAVEKNYRDCKVREETRILPLLADLTNPSPDQGWALSERKSISARGPADALLALALVHHLAIGNNVPLGRISSFFREIGEWLIIEFVPKEDSQVRRLLASREDVFPHYTKSEFEREFQQCFEIVSTEGVPESERTLYLMRGLPRG